MQKSIEINAEDAEKFAKAVETDRRIAELLNEIEAWNEAERLRKAAIDVDIVGVKKEIAEYRSEIAALEQKIRNTKTKLKAIVRGRRTNEAPRLKIRRKIEARKRRIKDLIVRDKVRAMSTQFRAELRLI